MVENIIKSFDIWTDAQGIKSKGRVKNIENISLEGITHLRKLILELAIRGKLVPQYSNDEPASELLKKIRSEKKSDKKSSITEDLKRFDIPSTWVNTRLGDIIEMKYGSALTKSQCIDGAPYPVFGSNGIVGYYDKFLTDKRALIVGRKGSAGALNKCHVPSWTTDVAYYVEENDFIDFDFMFFLIKSAKLENLGKGIKPGVNRNEAYNVIISLPPLPEQHRIVAKVDELMALCNELEKEKTASLKTHQTLVAALLQTFTAAKDADEVEMAWHRLAPHFDMLFCTEDSIDQLKQTILQLAIMGRLVKQDPAYEPASELLKKIDAEKENLVKEGKIKKEKPLLEIKEEEKPFALPSGWEWVRLGAITQINPRNDVDGNLKASFVPMALITTSYKGEHGQEERIWNEISKGYTHFADGDVGVAKITPCFENSKAVVFSNLINGYGAGTTELHIARPFNKTIEARFILLILKSPKYLKLGESKMTGTAGQKRLSKEFFSENPMPLPPLEEQKRIVAKVDALMTLCDNLKGKLLKSQEIQSNLSKTIIENAVA